jgi:hypothetical protein
MGYDTNNLPPHIQRLMAAKPTLRQPLASAVTGPIYAPENNRPSQSPKPQRLVLGEPLAAPKGEACDTGRVLVRITSYRTRLIDPDNLVGKYFVDCLRYCGVLKDDTSACIDYQITQVKVPKTQARTEIEVITT